MKVVMLKRIIPSYWSLKEFFEINEGIFVYGAAVWVIYLDVNDVPYFVHFHVRGKRDCSMCAEPAGEQVPRSATVTLGVRHFLMPEKRQIVTRPNRTTRGQTITDNPPHKT